MRSRGVPTPPQRAQLRPQRTLGSRIAAQFCQRPGGHQGLCRRVARIATGRAQQGHLQTIRHADAAAPLRRRCWRSVWRTWRFGWSGRRAAPRDGRTHHCRLRPTLHARRYGHLCALGNFDRRRQRIGRIAIQIHGVPQRLQIRHLQIGPHRLGRRLAHENALMAAPARAANVATATSAGQTRHTARRSPERSAPGRSPIAQSPPWRSPTPGMARGRHVDHGHHP